MLGTGTHLRDLLPLDQFCIFHYRNSDLAALRLYHESYLHHDDHSTRRNGQICGEIRKERPNAIEEGAPPGSLRQFRKSDCNIVYFVLFYKYLTPVNIRIKYHVIHSTSLDYSIPLLSHSSRLRTESGVKKLKSTANLYTESCK